jgi:hypothetical protein
MVGSQQRCQLDVRRPWRNLTLSTAGTATDHANGRLYCNAIVHQQMGNIVGMETMNCLQTLPNAQKLVQPPPDAAFAACRQPTRRNLHLRLAPQQTPPGAPPASD